MSGGGAIIISAEECLRTLFHLFFPTVSTKAAEV